ncbi:hypothetical protein HDU67_002976 [Dinochytrium kinnereticum]|nr:hypothetical protein HDU67_002976 [Dinochytrium kinnereticum]
MDEIEFKVSYQKAVHDIKLSSDALVSDIKESIFNALSIAQSLQKLLYRGAVLKDQMTLQEAKITNGSKITLIATQPKDILDITIAKSQPVISAAAKEAPAKLLDATEHKKILASGPPPDAEIGLPHVKSSIPPLGIVGLRNHQNVKTRVSLLLDTQELQIATSERTRKFPFSSVQGIVSEIIPDAEHENYYAVALQLGPTVKSRYWLYWVPAQYKTALEDAILGPFHSMFF